MLDSRGHTIFLQSLDVTAGQSACQQGIFGKRLEVAAA
jgi:hypothetical protein